MSDEQSQPPISILIKRLEAMRSALVAFSGGVDSALLADVAHEVLGDRSIAVTAVSPSLAPRERFMARDLAAQRGWRHLEVETQEHTRAEYIRNNTDRCYFCKDSLFEVMDVMAQQSGSNVCVGTNLDDLGSHRPGLKAIAEHGALQPLVDAGFTKELVREASRERGLPVADKPAAPCLASRVAYGVQVTPQRLGRIAKAEEMLWEIGVSDVRVRDMGGVASIEVPTTEIATVQASGVVDRIFSLGFEEVRVDPAGLKSGGLLLVAPPASARNVANME